MINTTSINEEVMQTTFKALDVGKAYAFRHSDEGRRIKITHGKSYETNVEKEGGEDSE